jgi:2-amino-4-hydroxy-6-hydroxymethyldihydropteridine pyrophosphokinase
LRLRSPIGPRLIDLDLLLFGNARMNTERLVLPHPRMLDRAFVLAPLAEIAPDLLLPSGLTVREALSCLGYSIRGRRIYQDG